MVEDAKAARLQEAIKDAGLSWSSAAVAIGKSAQAPTKWKKGQIGNETVRALADLTGWSYPYLLTGNGPKKASELESAVQAAPSIELGPVDTWDDSTPPDPDYVNIPLFKEVEMAAGDGCAFSVEISGKHLKFAKSTLKTVGVDPANAACATASGDSMEPKITDGATIGIDRGRTQVKDGKIYAIDHAGMLRVKYLHRLKDGGLKLRSENPDYEDEILTPAEVRQDIRILGWVFWWANLETW